MAVGEVSSGTLGEALPTIVAEARLVAEYMGTWKRTCDVRSQTEGTGLAWTQYQLAQLAAQDIGEAQDNRNYQQFAGSLLASEPVMSQIIIKVTDRTYRKLSVRTTGVLPAVVANFPTTFDTVDVVPHLFKMRHQNAGVVIVQIDLVPTVRKVHVPFSLRCGKLIIHLINSGVQVQLHCLHPCRL